MITLALAAAVQSLSQIQEMSPALAGDVILRDQRHGPIETFLAPTGGMNAPGMIDGQFVERPVASGAGCARTRWTVTFHAAPGADISTATMDHLYSSEEISLRPSHACPSGQYAQLSAGVSVDEGWAALTSLNEIRIGAGRMRFQCSDTTSSGLCKGIRAIRSSLRTLTPWAVAQDADDVKIWLGVPGDVVTEVRFRLMDPSRVTVTRRIPAPF